MLKHNLTINVQDLFGESYETLLGDRKLDWTSGNTHHGEEESTP